MIYCMINMINNQYLYSKGPYSLNKGPFSLNLYFKTHLATIINIGLSTHPLLNLILPHFHLPFQKCLQAAALETLFLLLLSE